MSMGKRIPYAMHELNESDIQMVVDVLRNDPITQGSHVEQFGQALAKYSGARYGVAVSSGSAALHLSVTALDIGPGDEVITSPMTFCATSNAILHRGADVKFVDIDPWTLNLDPSFLEEKITDKTKAIIPVDFRGHPANLPEIKVIADKHGLKVIEDGAQSMGSQYMHNGKSHLCGDGVHASLCTYSFHPAKHITTGEGGVVLTNDYALAEKVLRLRQHGLERTSEMLSESDRSGLWIYEMTSLGFNYRMTDFQAALGLSQLKKIDNIKSRRREIVTYYNESFSEIDEIIIPYEAATVNSNFHLYILQVKENRYFDRYDLFSELRKQNYEPMVHYIPVHLLKYYKDRYGFVRGDYPIAEKFYDGAVSLPLYPSLTDLQVEAVVKDVMNAINSRSIL